MDSYLENTMQEEYFKETRMSSARTIVWKVPYFEISHLRPFDSPSFVFESATWCLRLYPVVLESDLESGEEEGTEYRSLLRDPELEGYLGLTLVRLCSRVPHHRLQCHLKWEEDEDYSKNFNAVDFDEDHKEYGCKMFIDRLTVYRKEYELSDDGILTLTCQLACQGSPSMDVSSQTEVVLPDAKVMIALSQNYKNLLLSGKDHDVVLKVKNKEFRAHRVILRAGSSVLESMLSHDMKEKNSGVVDIPDCDPDAFEQFLIYLYCAKTDILDADNMLPLYYIADKYDMGHLKEECSDFIRRSLSSSNIGDVFELATNHSDEDLLQCAVDYFVEHIKVILPTAEWQSFIQRNGIRANELFIRAVNKMSAGET